HLDGDRRRERPRVFRGDGLGNALHHLPTGLSSDRGRHLGLDLPTLQCGERLRYPMHDGRYRPGPRMNSRSCTLSSSVRNTWGANPTDSTSAPPWADRSFIVNALAAASLRIDR